MSLEEEINKTYVSLHNHTTNSIMDSLISPKDLFGITKELGQSAAAVTDHGTLAGMWDSLKESKKTGVKLIAGCEFYFVDDVNDPMSRMRHVILIAKNAQGYKNLLSASFEGFSNFEVAFKRVIPRIDWKTLEKYSEGLICTTACANGILGQLINQKEHEKAKEQAQRLKDIFGDDLAIELQAHAMRRQSNLYSNQIDQRYTNNILINIAKELDIKCIVTTDAHYCTKDQHEAHNVLLAMASGQPIKSGARLQYNVNDFYIKSGYEVYKNLVRFTRDEAFAKECIDNTAYFANKCEKPNWIDPKFSNPSGKELPEFPVQDQKDYKEFLEWCKTTTATTKEEDRLYLRYKCEKDLFNRPDINNDAYKARLEEELDVLYHCGVTSYMLIVADILDWCRDNNISVGPGRGCLEGDAKVLTDDGFKLLKNVSVGDYVFSHNGTKRKVTNRFVYDIKETGVEVKTRNSFQSISMTKDHKVYGSKAINSKESYKEDYHKVTKIKKGFNAPDWIPIGELEKGDGIFTTFPEINPNNKIIEYDFADYINDKTYKYDKNYFYQTSNVSNTFTIKEVAQSIGLTIESVRKVKNNNSKNQIAIDGVKDYLLLNNLTVSQWQNIQNKKTNKINRFIKFDEDFAYLIGRWVGDGSFHGRKSNRVGINISFNADDNVGIQKIKSIINNMGLHASLNKSKESNGLNLTVTFYPLYKLFKEMMPSYENSYSKHMPTFFRTLPTNLLGSLVSGLFDADGSKIKSDRCLITTTSEQLALETKEMLLYLKTPSAIYLSTKLYRYGAKSHDRYTIYYNEQISGEGYYSAISSIEDKSLTKVYDLQVEEDESYLTSNYIVHNSAGGSLVGYLLKIHDADPIKYGLVFARFHSKLKTDYSDVDCDIGTKNRKGALHYITQKYGEEQVAGISNHNTMTPKVYAKSISRTFLYGGDRKSAVQVGNILSDMIPAGINTVPQALKEAALFAEYAKPISEGGAGYTELAKYGDDIAGLNAAIGTHAGGVIVNKRSLRTLVPLRRDKSGSISIEYEKYRAEDNGLVKMDFLGLSTLDIIDDTYELIKLCGKEVKPFDYHTYDKTTYDLISAGKTFCVFQFGKSGAMDICKRFQPKSIEDLAQITTLVRPAAKEIRDDFFKVKDGKQEISLLHPKLERAFSNTLGFALFDESLLLLTEDVAGWDLHKADSLRKMTKAKGKHPKAAKKIQEDFIADSINNGLTDEQANEIWDKVVDPFQKYSFNKAHAVTYSMISYHTAWLKAHYPLEFLVANLKSEVMSNAKVAKDNIAKIKSEIRNLDVKIIAPDINKSDMTYTIIDGNTLMTGLDALKHVSHEAIDILLKTRPFDSFEDFISKIPSKGVRSDAIQALAASGCLDTFKMSRKMMYLYASDYKAKLNLFKKKQKKNPERHPTFVYPWPENSDWNISQFHALEMLYLGEGLSGDKIQAYNNFFTYGAPAFNKLQRLHPPPPAEMSEAQLRQYKKPITLLQAEVKSIFEFQIKKETSKLRGQTMAKIGLEDPFGNPLTLTCFPDGWLKLQNRCLSLSNKKHKFDVGVALYINGQLNWYENELSLTFGDVAKFSPPPQLPADLKAKKVSLRKTPKKKVDVEESDRTILLDEIEDELTETGFADLEEIEFD